jgi:hypothetical protein
MRWLMLLAVTACTGNIDGRTSPGSDDPSPDAAQMQATPGEHSVERGALWVAAKVPYCQAANHQRDYDSACAATCTRPDVPDWDPYRSDCSGFVSWSWDLPAPGRVTSDFAPFKTDLTHSITASELRAGDAVNNSDHIMLFVEWTMADQSEAKFMEESGCSASEPYAREFTEAVTLSGEKIVTMYHGTFTAIRYDNAP